MSSEQLPKVLPVARAHSIKHKDVEGSIEVGEYLLDPLADEEEVLVTTSNVHLRQNEPRDAQQGYRENACDEQH